MIVLRALKVHLTLYLCRSLTYRENVGVSPLFLLIDISYDLVLWFLSLAVTDFKNCCGDILNFGCTGCILESKVYFENLLAAQTKLFLDSC